jgi:hypothetical protein
MSAGLLGGVLGLALVVLVALARPAGAAPSGDPLSDPAVAGPLPSFTLPPVMEIGDVYRSFVELGSARAGGEEVELSVVRAGELVLPSGRVLAADVYLFGQPPFDRLLPAGRHPVFVLRAERDAGMDAAAAMLRVAPGDPVEWEPATTGGVDPGTLDPAAFASYGVDSGTAAFASAEAAERLESGDEALWEAYGERIQDQMYPGEDEYRLIAEVVVDPVTGGNVIAFASGWGDGGYPAWFGLDADGEPLVLLTDFGILDAPPP